MCVRRMNLGNLPVDFVVYLNHKHEYHLINIQAVKQKTR